MTCGTIRVVGDLEIAKTRPRAGGVSSFYALICLVLLACQLDLGEALSRDGLCLLAFKKSVTSGSCDPLPDWNENDSHPCAWSGVTCDPTSLRVIALNIDGRSNVRGVQTVESVPRSYSTCARNRTLGKVSAGLSTNVSSRNLTATGSYLAPPSIGSTGFARYTSDTVSGGSRHRITDEFPCLLSGIFPPAIGNLSELRILSITFHRIRGDIPKEIADLKFLHTFDFRSNLLSGELPRELGKLRFLRVVNLDNNALEGPIPDELSSCRELRRLSFIGNVLSGSVPASLGSLPELQWLAVSANRLRGSIPKELAGGHCSLVFLDLSRNQLTGIIPPELGDCDALRWLVLNFNNLSGSLPPSFGRLSSLKYLQVAENSLSGSIPAQLADCSQLEVLILSNVRRPPVSLKKSSARPWTSLIGFEHNQFFGALPSTLLLLPRLRVLWAPAAGLSGSLPTDWGGCKRLESLILAQNSFAGELSEGLSKCRRLIHLDVSGNKILGSFPRQLAVHCMVVFNISRNGFSGWIPKAKFSSCPSPPVSPRKSFSGSVTRSLLHRDALDNGLQMWYTGFSEGLPTNDSDSDSEFPPTIVHDWSFNNFTGEISLSGLGKSILDGEPFYSLSLSGNQLTGEIPSYLFSICKYLRAFAVSLSYNKLTGLLPSAVLGNCDSIVHFEAAHNYISGSIPRELGGMRNLVYLDLAGNHLQGTIPDEIEKLLSLKVLLLASNSLEEPLPPNIGHARSLQVLDVSCNGIKGQLPEELSALDDLQVLYLNNNSFTGTIPVGLSKISTLLDVDFSYNNLTGSVPWFGNMKHLCASTRFVGNPFLQACAERMGMARILVEDSITRQYNEGPFSAEAPMPLQSLRPPGMSEDQSRGVSSILVAAITSGCAIAVVLFVLGLLFQCTRQRSPTGHCPTPGRKEVVTFMNINHQMTYENVVRATGNFSIDNLIGNGGFGATYKAELRPGLLVAVKRLAILRFQGVQQFDTEIRTLGRIRHPNLVTLIGYHASQDEMFLIYNYFPQGNLETLIHSHRGDLDWHTRHSIALRIAEALAYLHDECVPRVLHRDIKPSNILLDDNLNAHLSDFGLARLLGASETHATTDVAGTFGYVAPEYAMTCRVTDKADVYSYGVVLLELLSTKRALDPSFCAFGDGFNIVSWACLLIRQERSHEVFTVGLWEQGPEDALLETLKLAVLCTGNALAVRPTMKEVVGCLKKLQPTAPST